MSSSSGQDSSEEFSASGKSAARLRLAIFAVLLIGVSVAGSIWGSDAPDRLRDLVDSAGPAGPILFIVAYALLTVALFPGTIGSAAAGVIFGPILGTIVTVIGATIGATVSFLIGRRLGRSSVEQFAGGRVERIDDFIGDHPLRSMLALRLTPLFPFNLVNYAAGLTKVSLRSYVIGTAVGIIPGTFAFVALGSSLEEPGSPRFWASLGFLIALVVAGWAALKVGRTEPQSRDPKVNS